MARITPLRLCHDFPTVSDTRTGSARTGLLAQSCGCELLRLTPGTSAKATSSPRAPAQRCWTFAICVCRSDAVEGAPHERPRDVDLPGGTRKRRCGVECGGAAQEPRNRCYPGEGKPNLPADPGRRDADLGEGPPLPVHRLEVGARLHRGQLELEDHFA